MDAVRKAELLDRLVAALCGERSLLAPRDMDEGELWDTFRALVNTRPAWPADAAFLEMQDELLSGMIAETGIAGIDDASVSLKDSRLRLWKGDITIFQADAIVNAANSQMLGCWHPGHHCIDNAIHTFAGIQLRAECAKVMEQQGHEEPTCGAKITRAYNLPSKHVIHTVGPIANGHPTDEHRRQLASCYRSCLDLAQEYGLKSIAFCCISTGVFGFPQEEAAQVAVNAVKIWLNEKDSSITVVFNVFSDVDEALYRKLLF